MDAHIINEILATKVMGWHRKLFQHKWEYWYDKREQAIMLTSHYDPLTNISQAVEAMKNSGYKRWTLEFFFGKFLATIYDNNDCDKEIGKALDANECKALMYALVEAIGGKVKNQPPDLTAGEFNRGE